MQEVKNDYKHHPAAVMESDEQFERGELVPHDEVVKLFNERASRGNIPNAIAILKRAGIGNPILPGDEILVS